MISFLRGFDASTPSRHDSLVRERIGLIEERDALLRYTDALKKMRRTLYESYQETKGWKFPWTRYEMMAGMITNVLDAYEEVRKSKLKDEREEILSKMGIGEKADARATEVGNLSKTTEEMTNNDLESELERLKIETTKLKEIYRQENDIFQNLKREFQSLQKYGVFQRYIIVKLLIKIAGKSDL